MDKRVWNEAGRWAAGVLVAASIAACGQVSEPVAAHELQVKLAKQFEGATCRFFPVDDFGQPVGDGVGGLASLAGGALSLAVPSATPGLVRCTGGRYVDDSDPSGARVIALAADSVIEAHVAAGSSSVRVDVFSQALVNFARQQAESAGGNFFGYLTAGARAFDERFPGVFSGGLTDAGRDLVNGGLANVLNAAAIVSGLAVPDASVLQALIDDLSDGALDGARDGIPLTVNGRTLRALDLNAAIRRFRNNQFATYGSTPLPEVASPGEATPIGEITPDTPDNRPPTAGVDLFVGLPGETLTVAAPGVLANDTDPDGDALQAVLVSAVAPGTGVLSLSPDGGLSFQPAPGVTGELRVGFTYEITDGTFISQVSSEVILSPVPVVSVADAEVIEGEAGTAELVFALAIEQNTLAAGDTMEIDVSTADGTALAGEDYTALTDTLVVRPGETAASVTVTVFGDEMAEPDETLTLMLGVPRVFSAELGERDGVLGRGVATGTIVTDDFQQPPVAQPDVAQTNEDEPLTIDVLANDTDENPEDTLAVVEDPDLVTDAGATVSFAPTGIIYTPAPDFFGSDSFEYSVTDGVFVASASVMVEVLPVDDPPVAADDAFSVIEDSVNELDVLANDTIAPDTGETLSITALGPTSRGGFVNIVGGGAAISYQPAANDFGVETFDYTVTDSSGSSATATVTVTVSGRNDAPVAANLTLVTDEDTAVSGVLSATDDEGQALYFAIADQPVDGTVTALDPVTGDFTFVPNANFNGTATFTYEAIEGTTGASGGAARAKLASAPATVTINVAPVNDAPTVSDLAVSTAEDAPVSGTLTGSDIDGDAFFYQIVTSPAHGALTTLDVNTGDFTYTPAAEYNGSDAFTYRVVEGAPTGGAGAKLNSAVATVTLTVTAVDDPPSFTLLSGAVTVNEDAGAQALVQAGSVDDGDSDLTQTLTFTTTVSATDNASLFSAAPAIDAGGTLTFMPAAGENGSATVSVTLSDGTNTTAAQTFTIDVTAVDDPPSFSLVSNALSFTEDDPAQSLVQATAIDDGDPDLTQTLSFTTTVTATDNASLFSVAPAMDADGNLTFTLAADENGSATVSVTLSDGTNTTAAQTFTIDATAVDDPPSFSLVSNALAINEDDPAQSLTQAAAIDDGDPELTQTLTFTVSITATDNPSLFSSAPAMDSSGTLTYTPAADQNGSATISVVLSDGTTTTVEQSFTIDVAAVNDAPTFTLITTPDQSVLEDSGAATVAGFVTASDDGDPELAQTISYALTNDNNALFAVQPAVDAAGALSFTPAADANGSATVTMTANDSGGASSASQTFTIVVVAVNDPPALTTSEFYRAFDSGTVSIDLAAHIDLGPDDEDAAQTVAAVNVGAVDNTALFAAQPTTMGTVLSFQFSGDALGQANVTLTIQDDGGTANMGSDSTTTSLALWSYPQLELAGIDGAAAQPDGTGAIDPVISGNGRYVVFSSDATSAAFSSVMPPPNGFRQIYRRDMEAGNLEIVSVDAMNSIATGHSSVPCVSYDGNLIGFTTEATELGGSAMNPQVVVKDMIDGAVAVVSQSSDGKFWAAASGERCDISADGLRIAFAADNGLGMASGVTRVFNADIGGVVPPEPVEVSADYSTETYVPMCDATRPCLGPGIDGYGVVGIFNSDINDTGVSDGFLDAWSAFDEFALQTANPVSSGVDAMVPTTVPRAGSAARGSVDALGRYVVYETAENQAPGVIQQPAVGIRDLGDPALRPSPPPAPLRAVVNAPKYPTPVPSPPPTLAPASPVAYMDSIAGARDPFLEPRISGDGRFAVWSGSQDELGTPPANAAYTIYVKELPIGGLASNAVTNVGGQVVLSGRVARIHITPDSGVFGDDSAYPHLDFQGKYIVFQTAASNVLAASSDLNGASDVFRVLNPLWQPSALDFDSDGLTDTEEADPTLVDPTYAFGSTNPVLFDTDGDFCSDYDEIVVDGTDPNDATDFACPIGR